MQDTEPNNRVTTREFYDALLKQNDRMDDMERRILSRIDEIKLCFDRENKEIRRDIASTKSLSKWVDIVIAAVFSALLAALGIRQQP